MIDNFPTPGGHGQVPGTGIYSLPLDEVLLPQLMKERGYMAHIVGKWHLGMYKWEATPTFRGFDSFYGYYQGAEDYYNHTNPYFDLHRAPTPRCGLGCTTEPWEDVGHYSTNLFGAEAVKVITAHDTTKPFFLYMPWQGVHAPLEAPIHYVEPYAKRIANPTRRIFAGMISAVDEGMGNLTRALEEKHMLSNAVIVVTSDNGAPISECGGIGASNSAHLRMLPSFLPSAGC